MFNSDQKRAFIAVLLSGVVLFGWQYYFAPKQTVNTVNNNGKRGSCYQKVDEKTANAGTNESAAPTLGASPSAPLAQPTTIVSSTLKNQDFEFKINNDLSVVEMKNPNSVFSFASLSEASAPLRIQIVTDYGPADLFFEMKQEGPNKLIGKNLNYGVNFAASILDNGKVNFSLNSDKALQIQIYF